MIVGKAATGTGVLMPGARRHRWRLFAGIAAAMIAVDLAVVFVLCFYADTLYGRERLPAVGGPAAAVVFYNSAEPFQSERFERAISLLRQGKVDRLLFVGGYRPWRRAIGAETQAQQARILLGREDVAVADSGSYDTLSSMAAVCALRERAAPARNLVMVSDALHLARVWENRRSLVCLGDDDRLGFAASPMPSELASIVIIAHKDIASRLIRFALGDERYKDFVQRWRYRPE